MFVIEGMEKVRKVIEENRRRKLTKHKKLSNNTVIEIDNCSPLEILNCRRTWYGLQKGKESGSFSEKGDISRRSRSFMRSWRNAGSA